MEETRQVPTTADRKLGPWWMLVAGTPLATVAIAQAAALVASGRRWWCACGRLFLATNAPADEHTSQHVLDPYSWSHFQHGLVLWPVVAWLLPRLRFRWQLAIVAVIEAGWEVLENSPLVINRYRNATAAIGYTGDTVINSLADLACCVAGVFVVRRLGWRAAAAMFAAIEIVTIAMYHDSLLLNVLMLAWPIDAIREWQQAWWGQ